MILYIVRHAWAADPTDESPDDRLRPLTNEGRKRFGRLVEILADRELAPELIVTSPLVRCRETADLLARGVRKTSEVIERDELAPGGNLQGIVGWTNREANRRAAVAWVGHAPDVGYLTAMLIGNSNGAIRFAKGGVAAIDFDGPIRPGCGELRWLVTAKILGC
jgi:phosphohistidine phosphatase